MKYQINRNSWHYKYNKFIGFGDEYDPPNFCPYFWKTLLAIVFSPIILFIFTLVIVLEFLYYEYRKSHPKKVKPEKIKKPRKPILTDGQVEVIGIGVVVGFFVVIPISLLVVGLIYVPLGTAMALVAIGFFIAFVGCIVGLREIKDNEYFLDKQPNMIKQRISSWYERNCPMVEYV